MSIRVEKRNVVNVSGVSIKPDIFFSNKNEVREYIRKNPFPETRYYTEGDLWWDIRSSGAWWLPDEVTEEQKEYIIEMVRYFLFSQW